MKKRILKFGPLSTFNKTACYGWPVHIGVQHDNYIGANVYVWCEVFEDDTFNTKFNVHLIPTGFEYWDDEQHAHIGTAFMPDGLVWHVLSQVVEHGEIPARDGDDVDG